MSNLREIVRRYQEDQALRKYFGKSYGSTSPREIKKVLEFIKPTIDSEVERILNVFVTDALKGSPAAKRKKGIAIFNLVLTAITTVGIGYSVNIENWVLVSICSLALLAGQLYILLNE